MPFNKGRRLDDHERVSPIEELAQYNHHEPERSGRSLGPDLAFLAQRELFSEE